MAKAYSLDLRRRVVEAVERDGLSCNQAAVRFDVAISTAIDWVNRFRQTGSLAPGQIRWAPAEEARRRVSGVAAAALPAARVHPAWAGQRAGQSGPQRGLSGGLGLRP